jgi:hypothetical protein
MKIIFPAFLLSHKGRKGKIEFLWKMKEIKINLKTFPIPDAANDVLVILLK